MGSILLVDDSPEELASLRAILAHAGHDVSSVTEGELALSMARAQQPDLILLDVLMGEMDGYQLCQRLKEDASTADIPVFFLSGLDDPLSKVRGFEAGAVDYITKPFYLAEIRARVRTQLALREAQRQLAAQNAELREASKLQSDVERMLRHDLRVSLAGVIGFSELIAEELHPAHASSSHARIIASAGYGMLNMVHGSFDLLKMERGTYVLQAEVFDVAAVARQVVAESSLTARDKQIRVRLEFGDECADDALVHGEALLTHSLLQNLLRNALEASPAGGEVAIHFCMSDGTTAVALRNAGEVPLAIRDRFFERYATAGKAGGSGVGTYSARLMAETQHGNIELDTSEPGFTTVRIHLPAPSPEQATAFRVRRDGEAGHTTRTVDVSDRPLSRVLVAENDQANRAYLRRILGSLPLTLQTATDGPQALDHLRQGGFAAALVDLDLPGKSGAELVREFRQWQHAHPEAGDGPLLIGLASHADAATRERCADAGFDRVLVKPISKRRLQEELLNAFDPGRQVVQLDTSVRDLIPDFLRAQQELLEECEAQLAGSQVGRLPALAQKLQSRFGMYGFVTASRLAGQALAGARAGNRPLAERSLQELREHLLALDIRYA